jgi:hypothetical protein
MLFCHAALACLKLTAMATDSSLQTVSFAVKPSPLAIEASVAVATPGLLTVATLMCVILLSAAVLIRAAKSRPAHPLARAWRRASRP